MPRMLEISIEVDSQASTGYVLRYGDYCKDFGAIESRALFQLVTAFRFVGAHGTFLARQEVRSRYSVVWYGFKRYKLRVHKVYLGCRHKLTLDSLEGAAALLYSRLGCDPYDLSGRKLGNIKPVCSSDLLSLK